ncbi:hypothetical protein A6E15_05160 [Natrinema saccharevitans]|uniref:Uncharacterized protein n=1 Tax=Natrinema saccharevitans TaxID=301967 RepID=A0A1S8AV29_9EURY|nr:hypothetical protein A6E15_05160 [Natrinema saccharevitans]
MCDSVSSTTVRPLSVPLWSISPSETAWDRLESRALGGDVRMATLSFRTVGYGTMSRSRTDRRLRLFL